MKDTLDKTSFVSRFKEIRPENFSVDALEALFDFLEEMEEATGEEMEFDPIAICCEFAESDVEEINHEYSQEFEDVDDAADWLEEETLVVGTTNHDTVVYGLF